jgi:hypothetical protein
MDGVSLPVLTVAILEANDSNNWEPALTYPLPSDPTIDLIDDAIEQVLNFRLVRRNRGLIPAQAAC